MFDYNTSPEETASAMEALRSLGVVTVELEFSGGNDEGGVDSTSFFDADGNEVSVPVGGAFKYTRYEGGKEVDKGWHVRTGEYDKPFADQIRPATDEEIRWSELEHVLSGPIYKRYYTFAGEFYVHGTLTWDVTTGEHKMRGQESHEVWEDFED